MLDELHISGLGVIEDASLTLAPGLTVITGETGAGKTMLVTALQLLLGARSDSSLVRAGAAAAYAEARVRPVPATAGEWADDTDELVVSREIPADGRSRARINGRLAPVSALQDVLGGLVEVHAQHEHVRLSRPDVQRSLLDRYAGEPHARVLARYRDTHDRWRAAVTALEALEEDARERARTIDRLRFELDEIEAAALDPDTDRRLDETVSVLEHAVELRRSLAEAAAALGEDGAAEPLGIALSAVRRVPVEDTELEELRGRVMALVEEARQLAADLRDHGEAIEEDPQRLDELEARRLLLGQLQRKYGGDLDEVLRYAEDARRELDELERAEADAGGLEERVAELSTQVEALAEEVRRGRRVAAEHLSEAVEAELADLGMPHSRFRIAVEPTDTLGRDGADRVTYLLAANPGEPALPVERAASGGERSRISLAIEVALADVDEAAVLVFDEVDAGIGGATAMAVGAKLAALAAGRDGRRRQVLCVTHLAQLAAFADIHHVVEKGIEDGRTVTTTRRVADEDRVGELSRMLGGDATADAGLAHARQLLDEAQHRRAS